MLNIYSVLLELQSKFYQTQSYFSRILAHLYLCFLWLCMKVSRMGTRIEQLEEELLVARQNCHETEQQVSPQQ